jgi:hypothetical protein
MSETCETVRIKADNEDGFIIINKSDMTKDHVEFVEKPATVKPTAKKAKE